MTRMNFQWRMVTIILLAGMLLGAAGSRNAQATAAEGDAPLARPRVMYELKRDLSPALRSLKAPEAADDILQEVTPRLKLNKAEPEGTSAPDAALQTLPAVGKMPSPGFNFEGVNNINGVLPPDTNGDVGLNHYVQWVNLSLQIWSIDRDTNTATSVYGPVNGNVIWNGFGGYCQSTNDGDPIVLYDHLADRWFISQFALPNWPQGPFYQCIAVSQTGDPTGAWYRYAFLWLDGDGNDVMNDYPHFGVWPDGYYMTVNQFAESSMGWSGAGVAVYERDKMLLGQSARQVSFDLYNVNSNFGGMLPSDLDGAPPPAGTPNYFAEVDDSSTIGPNDAMRIWEFHVDWNNTNNSTFGLSGAPNTTLPVTDFNPMYGDISQPGTAQGLDNLADRLMHRLQYRYWDTYATLVANHTVNAGGVAGVRWYEMRRTGSTWAINQQGTYAGDAANSNHRWMASAAMDAAGDIAIGYSLSSSSVYPSIAYTARLPIDPPGTLPQGEAILFNGTGSQTHSAGRWGDYSMLSVDPLDNCTFWFTTEYVQTTGSAPWRTRIGSFALPSCLSGLTGTLAGTVTSGGNPVAGATVEAGGFSTQTGANGAYELDGLTVGLVTATVTAYGYLPVSVQDIEIFFNTTTTQDFTLTQMPSVAVNGVVSDGSGQGWPLYARIDIVAEGYAGSLYTDPATGAYSLNMPAGIQHSMTANAVSPGYLPQSVQFTPALVEATQDFSLSVDSASCTAPGYGGVGCAALPGGLLVGNVVDENTLLPLNGAAVTSSNAPADTTLSVATPDDPATADGFYTLFSSLAGDHPFTAAKYLYGDETHTVTVVSAGLVSQDFSLPAGKLQAVPSSLNEAVGASDLLTRTVQLNNTGALSADFTLNEVAAAVETLIPSGPFAPATRHTSPKHLGDLDASYVFEYVPPAAAELAGGEVLRTWNSGLAHPWGIGFDPRTGELWLGDVALDGGDDRLHAFSADGAALGEAIDTAPSGAHFSADLVYNPFTGKFWQVNVAGGNCMVEIDPVAGKLTGETICPSFDQSQRGLAFNPLNGSYYSGAWTNGILYHFDENGVILDSKALNINIAGLAFNPATKHLFVLSNAAVGYDVYVVDTANAYAILGGFDIAGMEDFGQAGLSMDCNANLWLTSQVSGQVFEVTSGEAAACAYAEVPWLTVSPASGSVAGGGAQELTFVIDAAAAPAGINQGRITVANDTPYGVLNIAVTIDVAKNFTFEASSAAYAKTGDPGEQVVYQITIHNSGNATDMYQVTASGNTWSVSKPSLVGPALAGGNVSFSATVSIPANAGQGASDTVTLRINSYNNPSVFTTVTLTTSTPPGFTVFLPVVISQ
ncbi:MAG: carboxypeptidase regulatory-like domain-containing protein [Chloroflexi bacterium]|nr:carboxypeptidase regulatory-like domain-containing protein [Chloroflexota bacterium]